MTDSITVKTMKYHGPGWYVDVDEDRLIFQLWAPNARRDHWAASWTWVTDEGDDIGGDFEQGGSAAEAIASLDPCPWPKSADALAALVREASA